METSTSSGGSHMADIRTSRSGSVCFEHDYALPTLVFPVSPISFRSGCSGPQMVQNQPVCFSRDPAAPSSSAQTTIGPGGAPSFSSPVVSLPVVFFFHLVSLLVSPPWEISLRHDLLTQARGTIWHTGPDLWKLWVWLLSGICKCVLVSWLRL